jgi:hypothetical protein
MMEAGLAATFSDYTNESVLLRRLCHDLQVVRSTGRLQPTYRYNRGVTISGQVADTTARPLPEMPISGF